MTKEERREERTKRKEERRGKLEIAHARARARWSANASSLIRLVNTGLYDLRAKLFGNVFK